MSPLEVLEPGDSIVCPDCDEEMLKCLRRPSYGALDYAECFEKIKFSGVGHTPRCTKCRAEWAIHNFGNIRAVYVRGKGWAN